MRSSAGDARRRRPASARRRLRRPHHGRVFGPVAFTGLKDYTRDYDAMVARDQWLKSVALVRPGRSVTLVVPAAQRAWMRLEYGDGRGRSSITLKACRTIPTPFAGGFTIDFAKAPDQGRCADLILRPGGRVKLFGC
jgi:hypothetical protein